MMHGLEKSDPAIVATKRANKAGRPAAEPVERRTGGHEPASAKLSHDKRLDSIPLRG